MDNLRAVVLLLLIIAPVLIPAVRAFEIDATDTVTYVIDGDTFDTYETGRIRLADVDAPERYEPGYSEATDALVALIDGKTVYLDIDNLTGQDRYGREVCVVYVRYNATHITNVNKLLLEQGNVAPYDFSNNEFNPATWTTYVHYPETPLSQGGEPTPSQGSQPKPPASNVPSILPLTVIAGVTALAFVCATYIIRRRGRKIVTKGQLTIKYGTVTSD